ncbi:cupin domain-containing protein [Pedobacter sp.]|uniref:cupin domain-containing protein n=1 Tax=Pedobacter sp. TaxID=1411316 RepID=UPI003BAB47C6
MEKTIINRRITLQRLVALMGAVSFPGVAFAEMLTTGDNEVLAVEGKKPIHIKSGGGKVGKIGEGDITFKFNKSQTDGHIGITESTLPVGVLGAPPHLHNGFDEICRVIQGTLTIMVGDEIFEVNEGDWHLRPRGIVHSFWNTGTKPVKFIEIYSPGGHESYMTELSDLFLNNKRPKPGALDLLAQKYDITFDWAKLNMIMDTYKVRL